MLHQPFVGYNLTIPMINATIGYYLGMGASAFTHSAGMLAGHVIGHKVLQLPADFSQAVGIAYSVKGYFFLTDVLIKDNALNSCFKIASIASTIFTTSFLGAISNKEAYYIDIEQSLLAGVAVGNVIMACHSPGNESEGLFAGGLAGYATSSVMAYLMGKIYG